jgi:hypothetical protein
MATRASGYRGRGPLPAFFCAMTCTRRRKPPYKGGHECDPCAEPGPPCPPRHRFRATRETATERRTERPAGAGGDEALPRPHGRGGAGRFRLGLSPPSGRWDLSSAAGGVLGFPIGRRLPGAGCVSPFRTVTTTSSRQRNYPEARGPCGRRSWGEGTARLSPVPPGPADPSDCLEGGPGLHAEVVLNWMPMTTPAVGRINQPRGAVEETEPSSPLPGGNKV